MGPPSVSRFNISIVNGSPRAGQASKHSLQPIHACISCMTCEPVLCNLTAGWPELLFSICFSFSIYRRMFVRIVPEAARGMGIATRRRRNKLPLRHTNHQFYLLLLVLLMCAVGRLRREDRFLTDQRPLVGQPLPLRACIDGSWLSRGRRSRAIRDRTHQRPGCRPVTIILCTAKERLPEKYLRASNSPRSKSFVISRTESPSSMIRLMARLSCGSEPSAR